MEHASALHMSHSGDGVAGRIARCAPAPDPDSHARASEIGDLVDVSEIARSLGFVRPVALTRAAWADAVEWSGADKASLEKGRLWDVLAMARFSLRRNRGGGPRLTCSLVRVPNSEGDTAPALCALVLLTRSGDDREPYVIMRGSEVR